MTAALLNQRWARWLVDELIRGGAAHFCVSPGSRSAPLTLAVAERTGIATAVLVDERAAGFVGLGVGKTGAPAVLICTSGTAAANYFPAVIEAHYSRSPLIVLTADRPPELRDTGAWQAIDQLKLYGGYVRWFCDVGSPTDEPDAERYLRSTAARAAAMATGVGNPPGPVHLNLAFREPLVDLESLSDTFTPPDREVVAGPNRLPGRRWTLHRPADAFPSSTDVAGVAELVKGHPRGIILAGRRRHDPAGAEIIAQLAAVSGYPILAEAAGGLRFGSHDCSHVVTHYEALMRADAWSRQARPTLVLQLGASFTWKHVTTFLQAAEPAHHLIVDDEATFDDPARLAHTVYHSPPSTFAARLVETLRTDPPIQFDPGRPSTPAARDEPDLARPTDPAERSLWLQRWQDAEATACRIFNDLVAAQREDSVLPFWHALIEALPPAANLFAANSMAVRDLDSFAGASAKPIRVFTNRGAAGIDGNTSTARGIAWATDRPTVLAIGDLALLHDLGGMASPVPATSPTVAVCFNDRGGGIFEYLPVAAAPRERFERYFSTPLLLHFAPLASAMGAGYAVVRSASELGIALGEALNEDAPGFTLIEIPIDRAANTLAHRDYWRRVATALD